MNKHPMKLSLIAISILLAHFSNLTHAASFIPLTPKAYLEGSFGDYNFGQGEGVLPLYGSNEDLLFLDEEIKGGESGQWLVSTGAGYRSILNNFILGGYLFGDYNRTPLHNEVWVVNPGIEFMTNYWDGHINGYLPVGNKENEFNTILGQQLGSDQFMSFSGHSEFDHLFSITEQVGTGVDGEVGFTIPKLKRTRVYLGGYFFSFPSAASPNFNGFRNDDLTGIEGGFDYPVNHYFAIGFSDAYDNYAHNTAALKLKFNFGGTVTDSVADIHDRMLDPVLRHFGTLNTGAGIRVREAAVDFGNTLVNDNIWFFTQNGAAFNEASGFANCTFEHPCFLNTEATTGINSLTGNVTTDLYVQQGTYNLAGDSNLEVFSGQNVSGRTVGFTRPAFGDERPQVNGTFILNGNNTINNLEINATNLIIIDPTNSTSSTAIYIPDTAQGSVVLNNVSVNNTVGQNVNNTYGILNISQFGLAFNNSSLNVAAVGISQTIGIASVGNVVLNGSSLTVSSLNADAIGIDSSSVAILNSVLTVDATGPDTPFAVGIIAANAVTAVNSTINAISSGTDATSIGILTGFAGPGTVSLSGSTVNASTTDGDAIGVITQNLNLAQNSHINVNAPGDAIPVSTITTNSDGTSTCTANGVVVPCS